MMASKSCGTCNGRGFTIVVRPGKSNSHRSCPVCQGAGAYDESTRPIEQMRRGQITTTTNERDYWRRQYLIVRGQLESAEALITERGRQIIELRKQLTAAISPGDTTCLLCGRSRLEEDFDEEMSNREHRADRMEPNGSYFLRRKPTCS